MSRTRRFFRAAGRILLVMTAFFAVGIALLYSAGTLNLYVQEKQPKGHIIWLPLPALAVAEGIRFAPAKDLREATRDWQPYLPAIRIASEELARCPDTRFVQVDDSTDHVSISKQGNRMVIDVDSNDERVHVSFPIGMAGAVAEELSQQGGPI